MPFPLFVKEFDPESLKSFQVKDHNERIEIGYLARLKQMVYDFLASI